MQKSRIEGDMQENASQRSRLQSRNVNLAGRRTSIRLEPEMWQALILICKQQNISLHQLCTNIERQKGNVPFTSAVRVFILRHFVSQYETEDAA